MGSTAAAKSFAEAPGASFTNTTSCGWVPWFVTRMVWVPAVIGRDSPNRKSSCVIVTSALGRDTVTGFGPLTDRGLCMPRATCGVPCGLGNETDQ